VAISAADIAYLTPFVPLSSQERGKKKKKGLRPS